MAKKYEILLCRTANNEGKAVVYETGLGPCLEAGDDVIKIFTGLVFEQWQIEGQRIENMPIYSEAQNTAERLVAETRSSIRPIGVLDVID